MPDPGIRAGYNSKVWVGGKPPLEWILTGRIDGLAIYRIETDGGEVIYPPTTEQRENSDA